MQRRFLWSSLIALVTLAGCGGLRTSGSVGARGGQIAVVVAENFWGSIAAQLGGAHAKVISIISNPNSDPHAYEPTSADGRVVAQAGYVLLNGAGYDPWMPRLVDANPGSARRVLTVADVAGRKPGDNPHMWYSPPVVLHVIDRITADYKGLDSADAADFDAAAVRLKSTLLKHYDDVRAAIKGTYSGVAVGATESIVVDLARDLGLDLITPPEYMKAISQGNDPTAADKSTFDGEISGRRIKVLVFNKQNATPDVQVLVDRATAAGIPVVGITETLAPPSATFQDWQSAQLDALQSALAQATGR
ncbi:MAG: metal ABC transporter solute-binding protein, Zn/Mn family [Candidatus Dormibacteria bacterium]